MRTEVIDFKSFVRGDWKIKQQKIAVSVMSLSPVGFFNQSDMYMIWGAYGFLITVGGCLYGATKLEKYLAQKENYAGAEKVAFFTHIALVSLFIAVTILFVIFNPLKGIF
jgi:hypothetical protein